MNKPQQVILFDAISSNKVVYNSVKVDKALKKYLGNEFRY